jgi:hypothetical protein
VAFHFFRRALYPGRGIAFAGRLQFLDGPPHDGAVAPGKEPKFNIEDGGFPYQATRALVRQLARMPSSKKGLQHKIVRLGIQALGAVYGAFHWLSRRALLKPFSGLVEWIDPTNHMMPWIGQGQDAAGGALSLNDGELSMDWSYNHPVTVSVINKIHETHKKLAYSKWGLVLPPIGWKRFHARSRRTCRAAATWA